jgi:hypothetical protein
VVGFEHNPREGTLTVKGQLTGEGLSVPYTLSFFTDGEEQGSGSAQTPSSPWSLCACMYLCCLCV